jgi:hypothetical protein
LVGAYKLAVEWVESKFPNLDETAKIHMVQLKSVNFLLEEQVKGFGNQNNELREKLQNLFSEMDWLKDAYTKRGEIIEKRSKISDSQTQLITDLKNQLNSTLQHNPN